VNRTRLDVGNGLDDPGSVPNREAGLSLGGELIALSPAVLVVGAVTSVVLALHQLTSSVPIVMVNFNDDPMAVGLAASISHPGGNITGLMISSDPAIVAKQFALLKELAPSIVRVDALLSNKVDERQVPSAAGNLNLTVRTFSIASAKQVAPIIAAAKGNTDALLFGPGPVFNTIRREIAELVAQAHLPAAYSVPEIVAAGGLIGYGS
jgi:putative tryptophan/tyrosine transport system substrate-binding protein